MRIKEIQQYSRPLERMMHAGPHALSDMELLALLIHSGIQEMSALDIAQQMLKNAPIQDLDSVHKCLPFKGIGKVKAARIMAGIELGKRSVRRPPLKLQKIRTPKAVFHALENTLSSAKQEHFYGLYLNVRKELVHKELLFKGTLDAVTVHPREIITQALTHHASGIIVVHNHPSGDCTPSNEDMLFTNQLTKACQLLGVELIDHIIVAQQCYYSCKREKAYKVVKHT